MPEQPKYATDLETLEKECEFEFFRSSGPGGQNVNRRETAVRLHHPPSGIVIEVQEERSQWQNRQIAFERLQKELEKLNNPPAERKPTKVPYRERVQRRAEKRMQSKKKKMRRIEDDLL